ncbi:MAG: hypothetical protein ACPL7K_00515 [Armatimonadota bacterium]
MLDVLDGGAVVVVVLVLVVVVVLVLVVVLVMVVLVEVELEVGAAVVVVTALSQMPLKRIRSRGLQGFPISLDTHTQSCPVQLEEMTPITPRVQS